MPRIRYAVVGLGYISQDAVLPAFKNCEKSELTALVSGDAQKLKVLGDKYGIKNLFSYEQYEECLQSGLVDAVYIALPNHLHRPYTEKAAENGIHVLCEKPMAVTSDECQSMINCCKRNQVKLMIAYRLHFEEANLKAIDLVNRQKRLGDVRMFQSVHSQLTGYPNIRTLPVSQGGGPTFDIGVYDINASRYIFQDEPVSVFAQSANSGKEPFKDIEETMSVILKFPQERLASIIYSFGTSTTDTYRVVGTKGDLQLSPAYSYLGDKSIQLTVNEEVENLSFKARDHFGPEFDYFSECILENKSIEPSGHEGLTDLQIIEAIYKSAQTGKIISLAPLQKKKEKPQIKMEKRAPAVEEPQPFHAQSPSKKEAA
jgi:predicted dehydrogenase